MRPRTERAVAAMVLLAGLVGPAAAHTKSTSYSNWRIEGREGHLSVTAPLIETARLNEPGETQPPDERIEDYLSKRLSASAGDKMCTLTAPPRPLTASAQFRRFEMSYHCPGDKPIALHSEAFLDLVPSHVSLAQIQTSDGRLIQQLFTKDNQTFATSGKDESMRDAGFLRYVQMGTMHIFTGIDHMSFLLGLVLISRRLRDLVFAVTGFTIGHSATLALAVTGIIRPHAEFIDALVALTIAMIGAENIAVPTHRPAPVPRGLPPMLRLLPACTFFPFC